MQKGGPCLSPAYCLKPNKLIAFFKLRHLPEISMEEGRDRSELDRCPFYV